MINMMIIDSHPIFREGIKSIFSDEDINVVFECSNAEEGISFLTCSDIYPDIIFIDLVSTDLKDSDIFSFLYNNKIKSKVIALIGKGDRRSLSSLLNYRIDGILFKSADITVIREAFDKVFYKGETYIQKELLSFIDKYKIQYDEQLVLINSLTERELEVLKHLASGLSNKETALRLDISERTVKNHVFSIFNKIKVSDRTQAAIFAIRNGIVDIYFT